MNLDDMLENDELEENKEDNYLSFAEIYEKMEQELLEMCQSLVPYIKESERNYFSVNREVVNTKEFHDKFMKLPVSLETQKSLHKQAGRLLSFVDGQEEERMLAVNSRTGELIVDNFNRNGSIKGTGFTYDEYSKIKECKEFVTFMHSHSLNGRPSAADLLSYLNNSQVNLSLVICHNGDVFAICGVKSCFKQLYESYLEETKQKTNNIEQAKTMAMTLLYIYNDKLKEKDKIFDVRRL